MNDDGHAPPDDPDTREDQDTGEDTRQEGSDQRDGDRSDPAVERRHERLTRIGVSGPRNSLWAWPEKRSPLAVIRNYLVILLCRVSPSLRLKNWLFRRIGISVGQGVSWGLESTPDVFWPARITVEDDAIIGYDATLLCHEFLQDEYRLGDIVIGQRAMIGAGAIVLPGVTVGEDAQVAANSLVVEDVPPGTTVAGVPAEIVSRADSDRSPRGGQDEDRSPRGGIDEDRSAGE
ncbi:DapH/DapD/GlmU-related protein [Halopenitus sp. H-Gu1]|uniref:acyltransferase n=1 Tax=Halopenitus sp. H-Gu1 TaxID=3242697 RepID=UPI00359CFE06